MAGAAGKVDGPNVVSAATLRPARVSTIPGNVEYAVAVRQNEHHVRRLGPVLVDKVARSHSRIVVTAIEPRLKDPGAKLGG